MTRHATRRTLITGLACLAIGLGSTPADAAPPVRYTSAADGHTVRVEGTSNIHDWTAEDDRVAGWIEVPGQWAAANSTPRLEPALQSNDAAGIRLRIPVRSLESSRSGLDKNLYAAMQESQHSHVHFVLDRVTSVTPAGQSNAVVWAARGNLTIAGTERVVNMNVTITPLNDDRLRIVVNQPLRMRDFGIDPPTAMMGMARAANDVDVHVTWIVHRQPPQPTLPADATSAEHRQATSEVLAAYEQSRAALAREDIAGAQRALGEMAEAVEILASLDEQSLNEAVRPKWAQVAARLQGAAANASQQQAAGSIRASFAVLSQALVAAVTLVGHDESASVIAYRHADQQGLAGAAWLQAGDAEQVRSPYITATRNTGTAEASAIYLGQTPASTHDTD